MEPHFLAATQTSSEQIWLTLGIIVGFSIIFPLFWCGIVWLISIIGDWRRLSKVYSAGERKPTGDRHGGILGRVGIANYKFTLTVHIAGDGFYLEVMPLFRPGHPRLFIPWSAVTGKRTYSFFGKQYTSLTIGECVGKVSMMLPEELFPVPAS